jgi:ABC-2 type transport system ATP-binding protein
VTTLALPISYSSEAAASDPAISLLHVAKRFPIRRRLAEAARHPFSTRYISVIRDLSCTIGVGEFFGLLGPNGAGKTTLFKMLATLVTPDSGSIAVHGHDVMRETNAVRRLIAPVIADERSLHWRLSGEENLRLFAALHGLRGDARRRRVDDVLRIVQLDDARARPAGTYSSGMRQRLLIARALLSSPRILLLDEPTRSLDPVSARNFRRFLKHEMAAQSGCTVLLATHSADEALDLCTRVAILDKGRILAVGRTDELAREFADDRFRAWTSAPAHPAWQRLAECGAIRNLDYTPPDADTWSRVEFALSGGPDAVACVVQSLVSEGVPISRFEPVPLSLADLLERVVAAHASAPGNHDS